MGRIVVVTDSTADLPKEYHSLGSLGAVVPLNVHFGGEVFLDGVSITTEDFYQKLASSSHLPKTSQPSPGSFVEFYKEVAQPGDTIISVHISSKLSGTLQSANLAKEMLPNLDIRIVDSELASMGTGLLALEACRLIEAGSSADAIVERLNALKKKIKLFFIVDTLEYLERNGRIGKAQALLGSLLSIKPVLTVEDGLVAPFEKVRGQAKAIRRLVDLATESGQKQVLCIVNGNAREQAEALRQEIQSKGEFREIIVADIGPVVGVHAGPGALGVIFYPVD